MGSMAPIERGGESSSAHVPILLGLLLMGFHQKLLSDEEEEGHEGEGDEPSVDRVLERGRKGGGPGAKLQPGPEAARCTAAPTRPGLRVSWRRLTAKLWPTKPISRKLASAIKMPKEMVAEQARPITRPLERASTTMAMTSQRGMLPPAERTKPLERFDRRRGARWRRVERSVCTCMSFRVLAATRTCLSTTVRFSKSTGSSFSTSSAKAVTV